MRDLLHLLKTGEFGKKSTVNSRRNLKRLKGIGYQISGNFHLILLYIVPGVRIRIHIRIRMDPPILDPLDPDPPKNVDPDPRGTFLRGKYGNFYIIDQKSQQPWYFFTVN